MDHSPVDGLTFELANLLIVAIKARRKYYSKASAADSDETYDSSQSALKQFETTAQDAATAFLTELQRQVQHSSTSKKNSFDESHSRKQTISPIVPCLKFLLTELSESNSSFHLRRSLLLLARLILERSSDARVYWASGRILMNFIGFVQEVQQKTSTAESTNTTAETNSTGATSASSQKLLFQNDAIDLIHHLALKFGRFYPQFTVASRLIRDIHGPMQTVSSNQTLHNSFENNKCILGSGHMRSLRMERDIALERGVKASLILERMIERAHKYFRILVPRFGGFMSYNMEEESREDRTLHKSRRTESTVDTTINNEKGPIICKSEEGSVVEDDKRAAGESYFSDDCDDSIDWEEGDMSVHFADNISGSDETNFSTTVEHHTFQNDTSTTSHLVDNDHYNAVQETLTIMERAGAFHENVLTIDLKQSINITTENSKTDAQIKTLVKLQRLSQKLLSQRLPPLNRWIHALSYADGMQERAVADPCAAVTGAQATSTGPVSLVLLPKEKLVLRSTLCQRMIKIRSEIDIVLQLGRELNVFSQGTLIPSANGNVIEANNGFRSDMMSVKKCSRLSAAHVVGSHYTSRKKQKKSRFLVRYRNN